MGDNVINCIGLCCPVPIIVTHKAMQNIESGEKVMILATDPLAKEDFNDFCESQGHKLISIAEKNKIYIIKLEKK